MKKYFFGIAALVLAISLSSFSKFSKKLDSVNFQYQASTYGTDDVTLLDNWLKVDNACTNSAQDAPCSFTISVTTGSNYYDALTGIAKNMIISDQLHSATGHYYVTEVQDVATGNPQIDVAIANVSKP